VGPPTHLSRRTVARLFLDTLQRYRIQHKFLLHEFVLMPDHFHLLLTPAPEVSMEKAVQLMKGGFSFRVKKELNSNLEVWATGYAEHRVKDAADYAQHAAYMLICERIRFAHDWLKLVRSIRSALRRAGGRLTQHRHG
jgi:REP element-mobilizing transposase RayT